MISKKEYTILLLLKEQNATNATTSLSPRKVFDLINEQFSIVTVQNILKALTERELISLGLKDGRANTYFISEKGIELLESINQ